MSRYRSPQAEAEVHAALRALLARWPLPVRQHTVSTDRGDTFVFECGFADGPAVVLLHGSMSTCASWLNETRLLADRNRVLAVDMIGEPGLSADVRPPLDSDAHAIWLGQVLDGLAVERAALVGISLGGWLALDFAVRCPARAERLALIVPGGVGAQKNILYWALPLSLLGAWGRRRVTERILGPEPTGVDNLTRAFLDMQALIARHFNPRRVQLPQFSDTQLRGLDMPVMAIVAGRDVMLDPVTMRKRLERNVRNLTLHYLPDARHFPGDQSARVAEFVAAGPA